MQRGNRQDHFSGLKRCIYATINHSLVDDADHPSPIVFLYDFSSNAIYLYCPVCAKAWLSETDIASNHAFVERSSFPDFSRCVPATKEQVAKSALADLMSQNTARPTDSDQ